MHRNTSLLARISGILPPPRLNVSVYKGVRYHRDGQVCSCRFCEIVRARAELFLYEDEKVVVFRPLRPIMASHVLIVPRAHIQNVNRLATRHRELLVRMYRVAKAVMIKITEPGAFDEQMDLKLEELDDTYKNPVRYSFHVPPFNSIDHVHMHVFHDDARSLGCYGRIKYRTKSWWCRSYDEVMDRLTDIADDEQHDEGADLETSSSTTSSPSFEEHRIA
ncbi:histidine triad nucleotide-binding protein 3 [Plasmopara halstedii]|uniref:Histidine triad nucleotide-binding protein 3 n=1 Tax=Plasmopara halstedii TaxID=4781 RepID=A0A0N7L5T1_PLAHL|nr:histidine triad nucleotide-binding protein 3 [Plasmopara halstedii]CEG42339.1 histidine triad nucleotide-binding protein 3 [Plasmopara halstedii]|eukprot:XP_024578708.1 histidine triad nucleotide-binding protein 3 [Plasmopara halstedii]